MKLAIIGSRTFADVRHLFEVVDRFNATEIISGGAPGADRLAECYATQKGIPLRVIKADWENIAHPKAVVRINRATGRRYDAGAGFRRNKEIVRAADHVIAFWDGRSRGTKDTIDEATRLGKPCTVIRF